MFPFIEIFGKEIGTYGICASVGMIVCVFVAFLLLRKYKVEIEDVILNAVAIAVGLLICGHLLFAITNIDHIPGMYEKLGFFKMLPVLFGGNVFYGGFLGSLLGLKIYHKIDKEQNERLWFDIFAVFTPLFHAFGRIGCFLGGCCYGVEASWGFTVHGNTLSPAINDVQRIPIQLIEAGLNLVIFAVIVSLFKKEKLRGELIYVYMLIYPVVRFVDEFWRGDEIRGLWLGLSTSQWISIALFIWAAVHFTVKFVRSQKNSAFKNEG